MSLPVDGRHSIKSRLARLLGPPGKLGSRDIQHTGKPSRTLGNVHRQLLDSGLQRSYKGLHQWHFVEFEAFQHRDCVAFGRRAWPVPGVAFVAFPLRLNSHVRIHFGS